MNVVPESPHDFFTKYVPERFKTVKDSVAGRSSLGALTFRVGHAAWSMRLVSGQLEISDEMADDVVLQVTVPERDFKAVVVRGAELQEKEVASGQQQLLAFKVLTIDAERIAMVRSVRGSMAFLISESGSPHRLVLTPGSAAPNLDAPECRIECQMGDFMDMQTGKLNPMQLALSGRIRILGNAQIPMALSGVFV